MPGGGAAQSPAKPFEQRVGAAHRPTAPCSHGNLSRAKGQQPGSARSPHVQPVAAIAVQNPGVGEGKPAPPGEENTGERVPGPPAPRPGCSRLSSEHQQTPARTPGAQRAWTGGWAPPAELPRPHRQSRAAAWRAGRGAVWEGRVLASPRSLPPPQMAAARRREPSCVQPLRPWLQQAGAASLHLATSHLQTTVVLRGRGGS